MEVAKWWTDWQHAQHAVSFDFRADMPDGTLIREYEAFNDVTLLNSRVGSSTSLVEIGCATGEFYRYLRLKHPAVSYTGFDVSKPALDRARQKYPAAKFELVIPDTKLLASSVLQHGAPDIVYSKDVVHHQVAPVEFLAELLKMPKAALIFRCRTRDVGATEWDPEWSCQYHYDGWMPYIVINTRELIEYIQKSRPEAEIVVMRNHMILGGVHNRFLPKDCYVPSTGTAETAVGVFFQTESRGKVVVEDRKDIQPKYTTSDLLWFGANKVMKGLKRRA
jgi:SAM-dependent methyltransferase